MDRAWQLSSENLKALTVYLADNMEPFDKNPYLPVMHAATLLMLLRLVDRSRGASANDTSSSRSSSRSSPRSSPCKEDAKRKEGKGGASGAPNDMYSCLKYCMKKSGLGREMAYVSEFDLVR